MRYSEFRIKRGDILNYKADALVCPVNCKPGVMGKGLAKAFAAEFPGIRLRHREMVNAGLLRIGKPCIVRGLVRSEECLADNRTARENVILFPTKDDWREPSQYHWIFQGLAHLYSLLGSFDIRPEPGQRCEIAFPYLGCGLGGLPYADVLRLLEYWTVGLDSRFRITLITNEE